MSTPLQRIAFIGFGEVGRTFTRDLQAAGIADIRAFDIAFADADSRQLRGARAARIAVAASARDAAAGADLIISAVTAGAALDAAQAIAVGLDRDTLVMDVNSVSPATKVGAAEIVERAGGRYVEAAVMAPVAPKGLRTSLLLGGRHADELIARAGAWRLDARALSPRIGAASSVKMCRSIMIKGLEALALECVLASRHYGVLDDVLVSLGDTYPGVDWTHKARYLMSRALIHGRRRAEEMREVAKTVAGAGYDPMMTEAIAAKQDWAADLGAALGPAQADAPALAALLAAIEATLDETARPRDAAAARQKRRSTMPRGEIDIEGMNSPDAQAVRALRPERAPPFDITKIGHVVLKVRDVRRAAEFYAKVLGFKVSDYYPDTMMNGKMVFMRCNADHHGVALVGGGDGARGGEMHHMAFAVATLDEVFRARDHLKANGVKIEFEGRRRAGCQVAVEFRDPDGHWLEIYWGLDQVGPEGRIRPPGEWRECFSLEDAVGDAPPGQDTTRQGA